jgi:2-polyprenyl-3-methyl-5-hydroxy-6-metoxy-1,4-benzoquinol methylase
MKTRPPAFFIRDPATEGAGWLARLFSSVLLPDVVQGHATSHYAAALEIMPPPRSGHSGLLELGAGHCEVAQMLRSLGWDVHAADIEDSCVAEAAALGFPATRLDLNEPLPFSDGSFDFVVMLEVIEHVVRAEAALAEVARVLSPGGRLLLTTPNHAFYKSRLRMLKGRPLGMEGDHVRFFVKAQLESLLAAKGFQVAARNSSGHLPLMDGRWVRKLAGRKRVLCRVPEWLEPSCAINFVWLAERVG